MTTKDIRTSHAHTVCDVCGRTLLRGERSEVYVSGANRRSVCELCKPRAVHEGWVREGTLPDYNQANSGSDRRRSLFGRRRKSRNGRSSGRPSLDDELDGRAWQPPAAPPSAASPPSARPPVAHTPSEQEPLDPDVPEEEDSGYWEGYDDDHTQAYTVPDQLDEAEYEDGFEPAGPAPEPEDARPPSRRPWSRRPRSLDGADDAPAVPQPRPGRRSRSGERPSRRTPPPPVAAVGQDRRAGPREPRHVRAVPSGPEQKMAAAVNAFNQSDHRRTVAGVARSLGGASVGVLPADEPHSLVHIVVCWELCWYRYAVDLSDEVPSVRLDGQGYELTELDEHELVQNAVADETGQLILR